MAVEALPETAPGRDPPMGDGSELSPLLESFKQAAAVRHVSGRHSSTGQRNGGFKKRLIVLRRRGRGRTAWPSSCHGNKKSPLLQPSATGRPRPPLPPKNLWHEVCKLRRIRVLGGW